MKKVYFILIFSLLSLLTIGQTFNDIINTQDNLERLQAYDNLVDELIKIRNEESDLKRLELYDKFFQEKLVISTIRLEEAIVTRVIDGDTAEIEIEGNFYKVRFIGINTPESTTRIEPYGKEASDFTKQYLSGKTVFLEKDISETDRYGRLLRYIWLEQPKEITDEEIRTKMFNAILVLNGYANAATYPPDVKYQEYFIKYEQEAREKNLGLWSLQKNITQDSTSLSNLTEAATITDSSTVTQKLYVDEQGKGLIKGNINSKGEKIYHLPGGIYYNQTIPEVWFKTEEEAQAAGFRRSLR
ncbi:thermonuclease family protein [Petrotoga sp. 9PWA.NaAc.5.4]|uniref:thermonuclease family protein n=1 Tax=Petrotoga sp. 9PWA.NaAc.5.4 TaxID=1434328 RepID=UPI000CC3DE73|nr:thermonuclease family protein [Petrotoga sp. 9PWA.NaAc.5.4]PNR95841.1 hypothetical protein X924_03635 [Petrotoga sp. 9PWA.NaAc.5.4]